MNSIERLPRDKNICLIDGDSLLYYEMDKPTLEEAIYGLDERISNMLRACNTSSLLVFLQKVGALDTKSLTTTKGTARGGQNLLRSMH